VKSTGGEGHSGAISISISISISAHNNGLASCKKARDDGKIKTGDGMAAARRR
jgi:hypothetical protein